MFLRERAYELASRKEQWINSEPLTLEKLKGKIVLLDFWTYSCVNCLRTLPALRQMWKKYKGKNVVIIGVHTPEFDFEKDIKNVKAAVKKHKIEYPVLNDPERINWELYGDSYWPRAALINAEGVLIFEHIGEAGYDEIDKRIMQELNYECGTIEEEKKIYSPRMSPEIYAGSKQNAGIGSRMVCTINGCKYFDPGFHMPNVIYINGKWRQEPEYLELEGDEGYIAIKYYASEANVVMAGSGFAEVLLNGKTIDEDDAGTDVALRGKKSSVDINRPDMYNVVQSNMLQEAELKINAFKGLRIYAFTFG